MHEALIVHFASYTLLFEQWCTRYIVSRILVLINLRDEKDERFVLTSYHKGLFAHDRCIRITWCELNA